MKREVLPVGTLPLDARLRLEAAGKIGRSGSMIRQSAINKAYRYIEERYPEYLHPSYNQQKD